ncbi:MAG: FecR domain-containing protein [Marinoscillum sp.]
MEELIYKYIQNELSPQERKKLEKWIEEDEDHAMLFKNFVGHWELSEMDVNLAKYRVWKEFSKSPELHILKPDEKKSNLWGHLWKVAAMILIAGGLFIYFEWNENGYSAHHEIPQEQLITKETAFGQKLTVHLPDGSRAKLNCGSTLSYNSHFAEGERTVVLEGEAFFDIVKDKSKPFRINSRGAQITVLGTSFNVNSYPDNKNTVVTVKSGKVSVRDIGNTMETIAVKDEKVLFDKKSNTMRKDKAIHPEMDFGWVENYLSFDGLDLYDAMNLVERWYGVEVTFNSKIRTSESFTARFKNPTLQEVMKSLAFAYDVKYQIDKNRNVEIL